MVHFLILLLFILFISNTIFYWFYWIFYNTTNLFRWFNPIFGFRESSDTLRFTKGLFAGIGLGILVKTIKLIFISWVNNWRREKWWKYVQIVGNENKNTSKFCENCGTELCNVKNIFDQLKTWWNERSSRGKAVTGFAACCMGVYLVGIVYGSPDKNLVFIDINGCWIWLWLVFINVTNTTTHTQ